MRFSLSSRSGVSAAVIVVSVAALSGCGPQYDPLTREGLWQPTHANRANLVLQVADPSDLTSGKGTTGSDGQLDSAAVERLRAGKVKKLPDSNIAQVSTSGSGGSGGDSSATSSSQ
jgi:type IV pilus biogenesis protein CpaD/CtpE